MAVPLRTRTTKLTILVGVATQLAWLLRSLKSLSQSMMEPLPASSSIAKRLPMQGRCLNYQPDWQPFPLLEVRADVVVIGSVPSMAVVKLARLVVRDAVDMIAQGHYIQALVLQVSMVQHLYRP